MDRLSAFSSVLVVFVLALACGPSDAENPPENTGGGFTLQGSVGIYGAGAGYSGTALLATLRDDDGTGPVDTWSLTLVPPDDNDAISLTYDDASPGSYIGWWFASVPWRPGTYALEARHDDMVLQTELEILPGLTGLGPLSLEADLAGGALTWPDVPDAAAYACAILQDGALVTATSPAASTGCDISVLPEGAYTAVVRAFSADLNALAEDLRPSPDLPAGFHVTEAGLAFAKGTSGVALRAAGGAIDYGAYATGLAIWLGIESDGTAPTTDWSIEVLGPGLPATAPWRFDYPAGTPQALVWAYDVPPSAGTWSIVASSGEARLVTTVHLGDPLGLPPPTDVLAEPGPSAGGATIDWGPVPGARSYRISVWDQSSAAAAPASVLWTDRPGYRFGPGTFSPGTRYDVYVAAATIDLTADVDEAPVSVSLSENAYTPATFTAE